MRIVLKKKKKKKRIQQSSLLMRDVELITALKVLLLINFFLVLNHSNFLCSRISIKM